MKHFKNKYFDLLIQFTGQCACRSGFGGRECCDCEANFWGDPRDGCYGKIQQHLMNYKKNEKKKKYEYMFSCMNMVISYM